MNLVGRVYWASELGFNDEGYDELFFTVTYWNGSYNESHTVQLQGKKAVKFSERWYEGVVVNVYGKVRQIKIDVDIPSKEKKYSKNIWIGYDVTFLSNDMDKLISAWYKENKDIGYYECVDKLKKLLNIEDES